MQLFQNYFLTFLLFLSCIHFVQINSHDLKSNQLGISPEKSVLNNERKKRDINIIDEKEIQNNKHIIPDEVEMIDANPEDSGTFSVYDELCHICAKEKIVPLVDQETKLKPISIITGMPCEDDENVISVSTRKIVRITHECCPGWRRTSNNCCMQPICSEECTNGEMCVGPDTCECPRGRTCKKNNDICKTLKPCDHYCLNKDSSFICICKPGFTLASDQRSCIAHENIYPSEGRDIEEDDDQIAYMYRLQKLEKLIENNKKAAIDLNKKLREMFHVTDFLNTKITALEKEITAVLNMEDRIASNEKNMAKLTIFANAVWKNFPEILKKNIVDGLEDDVLIDMFEFLDK